MDTVRIKCLLWAVLERAILDYKGKAQDTRRGMLSKLKREAALWLFGYDSYNTKKPFSFAWICSHLEIDPIDLKWRIRQDLQHDYVCATRRVVYDLFDSSLTATGNEVYYL